MGVFGSWENRKKIAVHGPGQEEVREDVGSEHPLQPLLVDLLHRARLVLLGRVVHQNVYPPVRRHHLLHHPPAVIIVPQIRSYRYRLLRIVPLRLPYHLQRLLRVPVLLHLHVREGYGGPLKRIQVADGSADARVATGHQRYLALELVGRPVVWVDKLRGGGHHVLLPWLPLLPLGWKLLAATGSHCPLQQCSSGVISCRR